MNKLHDRAAWCQRIAWNKSMGCAAMPPSQVDIAVVTFSLRGMTQFQKQNVSDGYYVI